MISEICLPVVFSYSKSKLLNLVSATAVGKRQKVFFSHKLLLVLLSFIKQKMIIYI